jgi:hypothetical protein
MRVVSLSKEQDAAAFARKAALDFSENPKHYTFSEGDPKPGELFAIRWNSFTVLVVRLDESMEPACYPTHDLIGKDLRPMEASVC